MAKYGKGFTILRVLFHPTFHPPTPVCTWRSCMHSSWNFRGHWMLTVQTVPHLKSRGNLSSKGIARGLTKRVGDNLKLWNKLHLEHGSQTAPRTWVSNWPTSCIGAEKELAGRTGPNKKELMSRMLPNIWHEVQIKLKSTNLQEKYFIFKLLLTFCHFMNDFCQKIKISRVSNNVLQATLNPHAGSVVSEDGPKKIPSIWMLHLPKLSWCLLN